MQITVKLFAILRDQAGVSELYLELCEGATIDQARTVLVEKLPAISQWLHAGRIAYAVNRSYAKPETVLQDGDELALIPPVSGGLD